MQLLPGGHRGRTYRTQEQPALRCSAQSGCYSVRINPSAGCIYPEDGITTFGAELCSVKAPPGPARRHLAAIPTAGRKVGVRGSARAGEGAEGGGGAGGGSGRGGASSGRGAACAVLVSVCGSVCRRTDGSGFVSGTPSAALHLVTVRVTPGLVLMSCGVFAVPLA